MATDGVAPEEGGDDRSGARLSRSACGIFPVRVLIHRQPACIPAAVESIERLQITDRVHCAHDHVIIRGHMIVVEVHLEQAVSMAFRQHDGFAHHLSTHKSVTSVDRDADIGLPRLLG